MDMKKLFVIILILIGILIWYFCGNLNKIDIHNDNTDELNNKDRYSDIIINILNHIYSEDINNEFMVWIYNNYGMEVLNKIDDYLDKNDYSINMWHAVTGKSFYVLNDYYHEI